MMNIVARDGEQLREVLATLRAQGVPFFDRCPWAERVSSSRYLISYPRMFGSAPIIVRARDIPLVRLISPESTVMWDDARDGRSAT